MSYRIKDWDKFQHFKNRNPPWIKLYKDILNQRDINVLSDFSFRILIGLWLLASEDEEKTGLLPDIEEMFFRLRVTKSKLENSLQELNKFVYQDDIKPISDGHQTDPPEKRREETEKELETEVETDGVIMCGEFKNVKLKSSEYQKLLDLHGEAKLVSGIDLLSDYMESKNVKYSSCYATLKQTSWVWERIDKSNKLKGKSPDVPWDDKTSTEMDQPL